MTRCSWAAIALNAGNRQSACRALLMCGAPPIKIKHPFSRAMSLTRTCLLRFSPPKIPPNSASATLLLTLVSHNRICPDALRENPFSNHRVTLTLRRKHSHATTLLIQCMYSNLGATWCASRSVPSRTPSWMRRCRSKKTSKYKRRSSRRGSASGSYIRLIVRRLQNGIVSLLMNDTIHEKMGVCHEQPKSVFWIVYVDRGPCTRTPFTSVRPRLCGTSTNPNINLSRSQFSSRKGDCAYFSGSDIAIRGYIRRSSSSRAM